MKNYLAALALALGLAALALTLTVPARADQDCNAKILATCTSCHYQTRICEKLDKKSRRAWKVTIKRMLRYGMVLDEANQDRVLECLVDLKKNHGQLCK